MSYTTVPEPLTQREQEVLVLLAQGRSNRQIAREMKITVRTVKFHTTNIYGKLGLGSRSEAIVWAWRREDMRNQLHG
jgi:NarL family two-component system response regulator LiaR